MRRIEKHLDQNNYSGFLGHKASFYRSKRYLTRRALESRKLSDHGTITIL